MVETANPPRWRRSARCVGEDHCLEFADAGATVLLRNSTAPDAVLALSRPQWSSFVAWVRSGGAGG
ncbi:MAG TPA: DUF397 domain-containing protein [Micromonosporaceae bacterium]|nr:DUF397 domain-containing protein [Micromonosporaceae bacterium]